MANTFKAGDVVTTTAGRSFSPIMVIKWIDNENCLCVWYNITTHLFEEYKFPFENLMKL